MTVMIAIFMVALSSTAAFGQTFTISGTVTDNLAQPVGSVAVQLYDTTGIAIGPYSDSTNGSGVYSISGVDPGWYDISFRPRNADGLVPVYIDNIHITASMTYDLTLQPGIYLTGFVHDPANQGILDVDLNVYDQTTNIKLFTPRDNTDNNGLYEVVIPTGLYTIDYRYRGTDQNARHVPQELINVQINADTSIDVLMPNGFFISGTVLGPGGVPVVDEDLDARDSGTRLKLYTPNDNTDNNGQYLMLVPPGNYEVNVAPVPTTRLLPGIVYNYPVFGDVTINFNLISGQLVSGTVRNPSSTPVYNVNIGVVDPVTGLDLFVPWDRSDSSGNYQFVLGNGTYFIEFSPPVTPPYTGGFWQNGFVVNGDTQLNVTVPWGYLISGTVFDMRGQPEDSTDIDAIEVSTGISIPLDGDNTDTLGYYATVIPPGNFDLEFEPLRTRRLAAQHMLNQNINADRQIFIVVDTAMAVSGQITLNNGNPIQDMRVTAIVSSTQIEAFTPGNKSDAAGMYEILIVPGTYDFVFSPDPLSGLTDTVTITNVPVAHDTTINFVYGVAPVAAFSGTPLSGSAPLSVTFTDQSLNSPSSWNWDFGDGGTSTLRNPMHVYSPGTYTVSLTVQNGFGSDIEVKTNYISVGPGVPPVTDFTGTPRVGLPPLQVTFTDISQNTPDTWSWNFGDGGTSSVQNPTHQFQNPGFYTISLTATNAYGSDAEVKVNYIQVIEGGPCGYYVVGDYNGDNSFNIADIVAGFSRLKSGSPEPALSCECPAGSGHYWAVAMDLNNSCEMNISDIVAGFSKLKSGSPPIVPCDQCPPTP